MNIEMKEAIAHFFTNPSFNLIFSEAFANALDAGATEVYIKIFLQEHDAPESLKITIEDNGCGFTDENFLKFSNLLKKADRRHKGLGRLVYLNYFKRVEVESVFKGKNKRRFCFFNEFQGENNVEILSEEENSYSKLSFNGFLNSRFRTYENIRPSSIKERLCKEFLPQLYAKKQSGEEFCLSVELELGVESPTRNLYSDSARLVLDDLPKLEELELKNPNLDLFNTDFKLRYLVDTNLQFNVLLTAICVDGRALELPLFKNATLPPDVRAIFLLESTYFDAKIDDSRQELALDPKEEALIKRIFIEKISEILSEKVPYIKTTNSNTRERLISKYPHLDGYFSSNSLGLIDEEESVESAQAAFFQEQKEILNAAELNEIQYEKSLSHATRVLTEYILYRSKILGKLEKIDCRDPEAKIHNLIVPMKQIFENTNFASTLYTNNAWLLDDKYMGVRTMLSDRDINELVDKISDDEEKNTDGLRPDIAFVFSDDIEKANHPVDVVVVELKRRGLSHLDNVRVIDQIEQRARRLASLYPKKIQRIWFFGVIDFDKETLLKMRSQSWSKLYSKGDVFYQERKTTPVDSELNPIGEEISVPITLLSFDALLQDAKARNETFLEVLREGIRESVRN